MRVSNNSQFFPSLASGILFLLAALVVQSAAAPLQLPASALGSLQIRSRPGRAGVVLLRTRAPTQDPTAEERQRRVAAWVAQQQQITSNGVAGLIVQQQKIEGKKAEEGKVKKAEGEKKEEERKKREPKRSDSVSSNSSEKTVKG
ncbi:hypothetical protein CC1G_05842 [Coprinopsis cinerea okayama7|uniref:Uncharacterized protein n=1 Tax=Coprinopsis cinerea (strain Okayama-7 / 130 / ATCC MYA-4618 / FGSC 9003) TaxID=240176 RepID=A8NLJ8_COPC7|nr:hypothetical protein CC1G_05842 [Coprinopsis cinerea okayama7\|eukprot:XP_001834705.1 hypothetical protein CC1G_05842 [Coprinopsis cinerea okayama7\